ncbi:hypothetical protein MTX20_18640 [Bradyrhizobium sp. ISRA435]|nr:hypothetical protein MTX20_18640 [Bradyrhizobium sp. ISRA435]
MGKILIDLDAPSSANAAIAKPLSMGLSFGKTANRAGRVRTFENSLPLIAPYLQL